MGGWVTTSSPLVYSAMLFAYPPSLLVRRRLFHARQFAGDSLQQAESRPGVPVQRQRLAGRAVEAER